MKKITPKVICAWINQRDEETNKGDYGRVLLIGGNERLGGAIIMAAQGAVYSGAGLVSVAGHHVNRSALHARLPEAMFIDYTDFDYLIEVLPRFDSILIGPGLGLDETAQNLLALVCEYATSNQRVIIDGDGITLYATGDYAKPKAALIFTPHRIEWERLTHTDTENLDDMKNQDFAAEMDAIIVLKDHRTRVYIGEDIWQNIYGTPAMATGGMGDTLAGMIAALMGQLDTPKHAVLTAVFLHSYIGETLAKKKYVVLPTEVAEQIPFYLKKFSETDGNPY
ncbi:ADP-dependent (S)-NAD(P)H-hydrate dehydratase [Listeria weihenstephanensis FSL R9-0317]|uniref:ADP-dependent (S)-NAD(P)H-hydrate dehydratase n=1 Tax=Listeria weihenstephanensis TaxID=1006155 RepID=A0A1S7FVA0_9LIST|nr:NAD(P)H-hydrate dehydratase [Listeria weihenstephanensis]AQY51376.1 carbohydrate kinase [Listeria weihenstephanensis]EUJ37177.1 ADP-dependent (S)-NAD(P)H-hydrate dehydratase [Listeria weihenstephanensis FSL R9-0317]